MIQPTTYDSVFREALRANLAQKLDEIDRSTHAVLDSCDASRVYLYGSQAECDHFAYGLGSSVSVVPFTDDMKSVQSSYKIQAYRERGAWAP